jgi:hypothetical protein
MHFIKFLQYYIETKKTGSKYPECQQLDLQQLNMQNELTQPRNIKIRIIIHYNQDQ